jgi:DNA-binding MarR family transcriptional regulator
MIVSSSQLTERERDLIKALNDGIRRYSYSGYYNNYLAKRINTSPQYISYLLKRLMQYRLVDRIKIDELHRRRNCYYLTQAGREIYNQLTE